MAFSNRLYSIARSFKSVGGVLATRLPVVRNSQNIIHGPICGQRHLFISTKLFEAIKVDQHGSLRSTMLVLDESDKEMGVMKWNQMKALALENDLKIHCVDEKAIPHPIYKLVPAKPLVHPQRKEKNVLKSEKVKTKNLVLKANISQRDLSLKINSILDWLKKKHLVTVKIQDLTEDKKHLAIFKEITAATSSVAVISNSTAANSSMTFTLVALESTTASPNVPKPLTIEELQEAEAKGDERLSQQSVDQQEEAPKTAKKLKDTSDPVEKLTDKASKTKKAKPAKVEEISTKSKSKTSLSKGESQQTEGKAQS